MSEFSHLKNKLLAEQVEDQTDERGKHRDRLQAICQ